MAVTAATLKVSNQLRIRMEHHVDQAVRELVGAWVRAWTQIEPVWQAAIADLIASSVDGEWPSPAQVRRAAQAQKALEATTREILDLSEFTGVTVMASTREVTAETGMWQARLIASQLPPEAGDGVDLVKRFSRVNPFAIAAIVERTSTQVTSRRRELERHATEAMRQALVRGVALGENPRTVADRMLKLAEYRFNGGLARALTIARTEILDAHRSAAAASQFDHSDTLAGWAWNAKLDARTCPSCWAQHGQVHDLVETGPNDHQCGRCSRLPVTKSWADLGFDGVEEPPSLLADAEATFDALTAWEKNQILGPVRLKAYESGVLAWSELSVKRTTAGWRDSWVPIPVTDVRRRLLQPV